MPDSQKQLQKQKACKKDCATGLCNLLSVLRSAPGLWRIRPGLCQALHKHGLLEAKWPQGPILLEPGAKRGAYDHFCLTSKQRNIATPQERRTFTEHLLQEHLLQGDNQWGHWGRLGVIWIHLGLFRIPLMSLRGHFGVGRQAFGDHLEVILMSLFWGGGSFLGGHYLPCKGNTLVRATVGVVSVKFWDFSVALAKGGGGGVFAILQTDANGRGKGASSP